MKLSSHVLLETCEYLDNTGTRARVETVIVPTSMAGATLAKSVTPESEFVVAPVACMAREQHAPLLVGQQACGQIYYTST